MTDFDARYKIRADLPGKVESAAVIGKKFLETIDALNRTDPIFPSWVVLNAATRSSIPLAQARARMTELTENSIDRNDEDWGYLMIARTPARRRTSQSFILTLRAGRKREGDISLDLGDLGTFSDRTMVTYPLFKAALLTINAIWRAPWISACVYKTDYFKGPFLPGMPEFPYSRFHLSWISYLSASLAAGLELPPEIRTERTPDGGILMIAAEERLEPTNPTHMRHSLIISKTMIAHSGVETRG